MSLSPICSTRAPVAVDAVATVVILPKVLALRVVLGSPNCGWFRTLKASKRYSNFARSVTGVILKNDASKFQLPGPLNAFRPSLPNAPNGAFTKDAVFKYHWLKAGPADDSGCP